MPVRRYPGAPLKGPVSQMDRLSSTIQLCAIWPVIEKLNHVIVEIFYNLLSLVAFPSVFHPEL